MEPRLPASRLDAVLVASPHPEALAEFYQHGFELDRPSGTARTIWDSIYQTHIWVLIV